MGQLIDMWKPLLLLFALTSPGLSTDTLDSLTPTFDATARPKRSDGHFYNFRKDDLKPSSILGEIEVGNDREPLSSAGTLKIHSRHRRHSSNESSSSTLVTSVTSPDTSSTPISSSTTLKVSTTTLEWKPTTGPYGGPILEEEFWKNDPTATSNRGIDWSTPTGSSVTSSSTPQWPNDPFRTTSTTKDFTPTRHGQLPIESDIDPGLQTTSGPRQGGQGGQSPWIGDPGSSRRGDDPRGWGGSSTGGPRIASGSKPATRRPPPSSRRDFPDDDDGWTYNPPRRTSTPPRGRARAERRDEPGWEDDDEESGESGGRGRGRNRDSEEDWPESEEDWPDEERRGAGNRGGGGRGKGGKNDPDTVFAYVIDGDGKRKRIAFSGPGRFKGSRDISGREFDLRGPGVSGGSSSRRTKPSKGLASKTPLGRDPDWATKKRPKAKVIPLNDKSGGGGGSKSGGVKKGGNKSGKPTTTRLSKAGGRGGGAGGGREELEKGVRPSPSGGAFGRRLGGKSQKEKTVDESGESDSSEETSEGPTVDRWAKEKREQRRRYLKSGRKFPGRSSGDSRAYLVRGGQGAVGEELKGEDGVAAVKDASYSFGYDTDEQWREEESDPGGSVMGSYSYIDPDGVRRTVKYKAGANTGFQILKVEPSLLQPVYLPAPSYQRKTLRRPPSTPASLLNPFLNPFGFTDDYLGAANYLAREFPNTPAASAPGGFKFFTTSRGDDDDNSGGFYLAAPQKSSPYIQSTPNPFVPQSTYLPQTALNLNSLNSISPFIYPSLITADPWQTTPWDLYKPWESLRVNSPQIYTRKVRKYKGKSRKSRKYYQDDLGEDEYPTYEDPYYRMKKNSRYSSGPKMRRRLKTKYSGVKVYEAPVPTSPYEQSVRRYEYPSEDEYPLQKWSPQSFKGEKNRRVYIVKKRRPMTLTPSQRKEIQRERELERERDYASFGPPLSSTFPQDSSFDHSGVRNSLDEEEDAFLSKYGFDREPIPSRTPSPTPQEYEEESEMDPEPESEVAQRARMINTRMINSNAHHVQELVDMELTSPSTTTPMTPNDMEEPMEREKQPAVVFRKEISTSKSVRMSRNKPMVIFTREKSDKPIRGRVIRPPSGQMTVTEVESGDKMPEITSYRGGYGDKNPLLVMTTRASPLFKSRSSGIQSSSSSTPTTPQQGQGTTSGAGILKARMMNLAEKAQQMNKQQMNAPFTPSPTSPGFSPAPPTSPTSPSLSSHSPPTIKIPKNNQKRVRGQVHTTISTSASVSTKKSGRTSSSSAMSVSRSPPIEHHQPQMHSQQEHMSQNPQMEHQQPITYRPLALHQSFSPMPITPTSPSLQMSLGPTPSPAQSLHLASTVPMTYGNPSQQMQMHQFNPNAQQQLQHQQMQMYQQMMHPLFQQQFFGNRLAPQHHPQLIDYSSINPMFQHQQQQSLQQQQQSQFKQSSLGERPDEIMMYLN